MLKTVRHIVVALALLVTLVAGQPAQARRHKSTRAHLKTEVAEAGAPADTLRADSAALRFSGYEKVQSATKETLFVTNPTDRHITALCITLVYVDTCGRELHRRTEQLAVDLPAGATRQLQLKSWDSQKVWHYIHTQGRHNAYSTPYDIHLTLEWALAEGAGG